MFLGRQHGAVCLKRFTSQGLLVKQRKNRSIYHGTCAAHFHSSWGVCGGVANVCIALHMWCAEHCTCGALHVAHVQIIALYVFGRCSSARVVGGRAAWEGGGGARDGGFLFRRRADACVALATTRWAAMGAAAQKANAPPSRRGGRLRSPQRATGTVHLRCGRACCSREVGWMIGGISKFQHG